MPNSSRPTISIVVPSFNQAQFLPRTLDSILGQNYRPIEVWIADGASKDGSVAILKDYARRYPEIHFLSEPDRGPADAVNKGLARVTGDIIGIQSSDDVYYPEAFNTVAETFARHPDVGFVCGDVEGIDEHDRVTYRNKVPVLSWEGVFARSLSIPQSSIFFRRSVSQEAGGWNGSYYGCDLDYWLRLLFRTRGLRIPAVLSAWRRYEGQRTRPDQYKRIWDDYWRMIDTSPDIAAAPPSVRRLARASKHLFVLRCPPSTSRWVIFRHLLLGALLHPGFWRYNHPTMLAAQFPGFELLRKPYRRLRHWLRPNTVRTAVLPKPEQPLT